MAVIRIQKTDNYTVMSNHHLRNKDMSLKAKGLMSLMLSLPPSWDYSIGGLVSICKESHTSIRSAIRELEENKYLIRERKNNEKGYFIYEYTLYEMPQPHTENQHTVEKHTENTHTENNRQISKEELITNKLSIDELNKDKNKEIDDVLISSVSDNELRELYKDYIAMRKEIDAPLTARGLKMLITRCERLSQNNVRVQKLLLENSIVNGWKNVFEPTESDLALASQETREDLKHLLGLEQISMKQTEVINWAMRGVIEVMSQEQDESRKVELNNTLRELARMFAEAQCEERRQGYLSCGR